MTITEFFATIEALGFRPAEQIGIRVVEPAPAYRVKGTTGDITTCDRCGRTDLVRTVIVAELDADGAEGEILHVGTDCAARLARLTEREVREAADSADRKAAAERARATEARFRAWLATEHGVTLPAYVRPADWYRPVGPFKNHFTARAVFAGKAA